MANKMTKKDYFVQLLEIPAVAENSSLVDFINHELELLAKKNSRGSSGQTQTQKDNDNLKVQILEIMEEGQLYSATEIHKALGDVMADFQIQKTSALLKQLVDSGKVTKTTDKKKTFFQIA